MNGALGGRADYTGEGITEQDAPEAPLPLVQDWLDQAIARHEERGDVPEPAALWVATVDADGMPDVRAVLMRFLDAQGPGFLTSSDSAKGLQLAANDKVAATLTWAGMFRAVRFRGRAQELPTDLVDDYFRSRPYGSRISAHASTQSAPVADRATLEQAYQECAERWPDRGRPDDVPRPTTWSGYRIVPERVEVWGGRRNRLHDRLVWERVAAGGLDDPAAWRRSRIQP
ncbi:pyridoxamine 5'-phosphate oxidase [Serinicoccus sp. CNJ-927]|uniref:pyridoxamine 5'-phosphate oxidase n=1 Tax=Serinicoccus sp. CNJ-927 TaxID=1904970 RepID=UPI00095F6E7E|nr:pyridoxamine 5'-phosphate oxidase [Serinicoccus sp. CNJ-927]OLT43342.1 pyridoxamine 5'-phosphate oxidase [Serinicoccus sp. CNJ-927]